MPWIIVPLAIDIVTFGSLWASNMSSVAKILLTMTIILKYAIQLVGIYVGKSVWKRILCVSALIVCCIAPITIAFVGEWYVFVHCLAGMLLFVGWWSISTFNLSWESNRRKDESCEMK